MAEGTIITREKDNALIMEDIAMDIEEISKDTASLAKHDNWRVRKEKDEEKRREEELENLRRNKSKERRQERFQRTRDRLTMFYDKWFRKKKLFKKIANGFKKLVEASASGFMKLLKLLLFFAIFPGLLDALINIFINIAIMLIRILARHLPRIIRTMIRIITEVLPDAWRRIMDALLPELSNMFSNWADDLQEGPLKSILGFFGDFFGNRSVQAFFKGLGSLIPYIVAFMAASAVWVRILRPFLTFLSPVMRVARRFIPFLIRNAGILKNVLRGLLGPVGLLIGALVALWINAERITEEIHMAGRNLYQGQLQDRGLSAEAAGRRADTMGLQLSGGVGQLAEFFSDIQNDNLSERWSQRWEDATEDFDLMFTKIGKWFFNAWKGIKKWFTKAWKSITGFVKGAKDGFMDTVNSIWNGISRVFRGIGDFFRNTFGAVFERLAPVMNTIKGALDSIWDVVSGTIMRGFNWVKDAIGGVIDWFRAFAANPFRFMADEDRRERLLTAARITRLAGEEGGASTARRLRVSESSDIETLAERSAQSLNNAANALNTAVQRRRRSNTQTFESANDNNATANETG